MTEMKYTKKTWFVNRFDIVVCALVGPVLVAMIIFAKLGNVGFAPKEITSGLMFGLLVMIALNAIMALVVVHKAWGWLMLPVYAVVRVLVTVLASLCGLLAMAMLAYQSQAKEKFSKAWTQDNRSRNYREGTKDAETAEGFKSAGSGLWGFLVSHTLEFCER